MIKKIGIVSRYDKHEALELVEKIISNFRDDVDIYLAPRTAEHLGNSYPCMAIDSMRAAGVELIISIGGDGTVLRTISKMDDPLPLLAINMGTLGFLVDVKPEDAIKTIENVLKGFTYTERFRLAVQLNEENLPCATNELVLITSRAAKILSFSICVDESLIDELRADGVVIATPTGSTAYAMSAGGPIIDPRVDAILIVPLAPFKLSARPWVVPGSSKIKLTMTTPEKEAAIVIDGQHTYHIHEKDVITLSKAKNPARFVKMNIDGFYEKVKNKLA
ncbi:MAG: NAD(+)/NADH kinase [Methanomethylovorans sp.]|jgi:NAD+ kinase|nr:NAD(+)/NADH kinase [Methanomethylovorans sp.]